VQSLGRKAGASIVALEKNTCPVLASWAKGSSKDDAGITRSDAVKSTAHLSDVESFGRAAGDDPEDPVAEDD
jgi:hypothetical protein